MRQEQVPQHLLAEGMAHFGQAFADEEHAFEADVEIMFREVHHRVLQERHVPNDAIVAMDGHRGDKRLGKAHDEGAEVGRLIKIVRLRAGGEDHVIALLDGVVPVAVDEAHAARGAEDVPNRVVKTGSGIVRHRI